MVVGKFPSHVAIITKVTKAKGENTYVYEVFDVNIACPGGGNPSGMGRYMLSVGGNYALDTDDLSSAFYIE